MSEPAPVAMIGRGDAKAILLNMAHEAHEYSDVIVIVRRKDGMMVINNTTLTFDRLCSLAAYLQKFVMSCVNVIPT